VDGVCADTGYSIVLLCYLLLASPPGGSSPSPGGRAPSGAFLASLRLSRAPWGSRSACVRPLRRSRWHAFLLRGLCPRLAPKRGRAVGRTARLLRETNHLPALSETVADRMCTVSLSAGTYPLSLSLIQPGRGSLTRPSPTWMEPVSLKEPKPRLRLLKRG